jgi:hypothetical protein
VVDRFSETPALDTKNIQKKENKNLIGIVLEI